MQPSDSVQPFGYPSTGQPATLLIDDLHIMMILSSGRRRYLNGTRGRCNPLPVEFEKDSEPLARQLDKAVDVGTYGVHVLTKVTTPRLRKGTAPKMVLDLQQK